MFDEESRKDLKYMKSLLDFLEEKPLVRIEREHWVKQTTYELIIDENLKRNFLKWAKGKWTYRGKEITSDDYDKLIKHPSVVTQLCKINLETESGYEEGWHDGSRWEGDYNPDGAYNYIKTYSLGVVIGEMPEELKKYEIQTEWKQEDLKW